MRRRDRVTRRSLKIKLADGRTAYVLSWFFEPDPPIRIGQYLEAGEESVITDIHPEPEQL